MKLVKYYKDNCPGCELIKLAAKNEGITFDQEIHAVDEMTPAERNALALRAVPTVILFDESGQIVDRMSGSDLVKLRELVTKRGE